MTEEPYPPLRPQRPAPLPRRSTPWPMILGVAVLALLAGAVLAILIGERDRDGVGGSPETSATASPSGSGSPAASESGSAPASASAEAAPSAPAEFARDTIVATAVDRLSVRRDPGTGAERLGSLATGSDGFVVQGPSPADGFDWYLVSNLGLPPNSGCAVPELETDPYNCPVWFGWVAAASEDGERWLEPVELDCPSEPLTAEAVILARTDLQRLACFGATPFTFRAWLPEIPDDATPPAGGQSGPCTAADRPSGWLLCQNVNFNYVTLNDREGYGGVGVQVSINPASGLSMPARGTWVELRVHLDDPAAQACTDGAEQVYDDPIPEQAILNCRGEMVLEAIQPVDGP